MSINCYYIGNQIFFNRSVISSVVIGRFGAVSSATIIVFPGEVTLAGSSVLA